MDIEAQATIDNLKEENLRLRLELNELKSDCISKTDYDYIMSEPKFNSKLGKLLKQENVIESDGQYEIPEGWVEFNPVYTKPSIGSNIKDFRYVKIEKEGKLIHHFIYITDFNIVKVFDKATGKMYNNNELEVKL